MLSKFYYQSESLGKIVGVVRDDALVGLWFSGQKHDGGKYDLNQIEVAETETSRVISVWLDDYFAGKVMDIEGLALKPEGTDYQKRVWDALRSIPYGKQTSYKAIAELLNQEKPERLTSPRAVGGAVGRNPISILLPCHRVLALNQALTGYAGGLDRKVRLLAIEGYQA